MTLAKTVVLSTTAVNNTDSTSTTNHHRRRWNVLELPIIVTQHFPVMLLIVVLTAASTCCTTSSVDALLLSSPSPSPSSSSLLMPRFFNKNKKNQKNVVAGAVLHHNSEVGDGGIEEGSRRMFLRNSVRAVASTAPVAVAAAFGGAGWMTVPALASAAAAAGGTGGKQPDLKFQTATSGLQWADVKIGTGTPLSRRSSATIDYSMSTTGARYGSKIYTTANTDNPYRFTIGDGSTIEGIEQAIVGISGDNSNSNLPPMLPGGIRRLIIPSSNGLGYTKLAENPKELCVQGGRPGPIPPPNEGAFEEYQRFKNIYCNPERQYQPDIVIDIKLYGPRR